MNTNDKQNQKNQQQRARQKQGPKKRGQISRMLHEEPKHHDQEYPETRMTR
jgi:hypothetical protein